MEMQAYPRVGIDVLSLSHPPLYQAQTSNDRKKENKKLLITGRFIMELFL